MRVLEDRIVIGPEDFIAGFVPIPSNNSNRVFGKSGNGASFMRDFDPFRLPGIAYPGRSPSTVTGATSATPSAVLVDAAQDLAGAVNAYLIGGDYLHRCDVTSNTLATTGGFPYQLSAIAAHSTHTTRSLALGQAVIYDVAGTRRLFYSYNDNTDWDVGTYDLSSAPPTGIDDDFMSTVPATPLGTTAADLTEGAGLPHPMLVSQQDALLYIGSSRFVHTYDGATGANGTFNRRAMSLPVGYEVKGFAEEGFDLIVFGDTSARTGRRGIATAFFYGLDRSALPYKKISLEDDEVSAPMNYGGTVICFTRNRSDGRSALRILAGGKFEAKAYWSGSLPVNGGVEIQNNLILWQSGGLVYGYGLRDSEFPLGFFQFSRGTGTTAGLLRSFIVGDLYISSGAGTSGGLERFVNYAASANFQSMTAYPNFPKSKRGRITEVRVTFFSIASGGRSLEISVVTNGGQTTTTIATAITSVTTANMIRRYIRDTSNAAFPVFSDLRIHLVWESGSGATDAPGTVKVEVFFEPVDF